MNNCGIDASKAMVKEANTAHFQLRALAWTRGSGQGGAVSKGLLKVSSAVSNGKS